MRPRIAQSVRSVPSRCATTFLIALSFVAAPSHAYVRLDPGAASGGTPVLHALDLASHDVNSVFLMVSNQGPIGLNIQTSHGVGFFPANTSNNYVFGTGLWLGARFDADGDSLLDKVFTQGYNPLAGDSEFREGRGDQLPDDPLTRIFDSTDSNDLGEWPPQFSDPGTGDPIVYSDQDLVTTYTTKDKSPVFGDFQLPVEVNQRSLAVVTPDSMAQVIFFLFEMTNTGTDTLQDAWIGYDADMDIGGQFADDLSAFLLDRTTPAGDTVRLDTGFAWDSDFSESDFTGTPGFVGITYLMSPGDPNDGIDNDGDGVVDESSWNGVDDDGDGSVDEWDEVDEIGLVNFSKHCSPSAPCEVNDPQTDPDGYDLLACDTPGSQFDCLEGTTPADVRFMTSSGPFDWAPGQTQRFAMAMVFAYAVGDPPQLDFVGDPPRPDPDSPALVGFVRVIEQAQAFFHTLFPELGIGDGDGTGGGAGLPKAFALRQNYPNPFNPVTTIGFDVKSVSRGDGIDLLPVDLSIFDLRGRLVRTLVHGDRAPGSYEVQWDGRGRLGEPLPSGAYLYRLRVGDAAATRRMTMIK